MTQLVHPDYRDNVIDRVKRRLKGEAVPTRHEVKILTKNNQECWVDITAGLINYGGKPAVLGTAVDITEHKHTEAALKREKELAQVPLESIGEGVVTTDPSNISWETETSPDFSFALRQHDIDGFGKTSCRLR